LINIGIDTLVLHILIFGIMIQEILNHIGTLNLYEIELYNKPFILVYVTFFFTGDYFQKESIQNNAVNWQK